MNRSVEELLDLARANAQALIIATTGYLAQAGIPLEGWSGLSRVGIRQFLGRFDGETPRKRSCRRS